MIFLAIPPSTIDDELDILSDNDDCDVDDVDWPTVEADDDGLDWLEVDRLTVLDDDDDADWLDELDELSATATVNPVLVNPVDVKPGIICYPL